VPQVVTDQAASEEVSFHQRVLSFCYHIPPAVAPWVRDVHRDDPATVRRVVSQQVEGAVFDPGHGVTMLPFRYQQPPATLRPAQLEYPQLVSRAEATRQRHDQVPAIPADGDLRPLPAAVQHQHRLVGVLAAADPVKQDRVKPLSDVLRWQR